MTDITFDDFEDSDQTADIKTNTHPPTEHRYAGFWMRFWAYITDLIVVFSVNGIILSPLLLFNEGAPITISHWTANGILAAVMFYVYFVLMTKFLGQTIGKIVFGIKVIRIDGEPVTWIDMLFREVIGRFIHRVFFFCFVLYAIVAFQPKKRGIHDLFGNTVVVHVD